MKKYLSTTLIFLCLGCTHPISQKTNLSSNPTYIEFSPIRAGLKSQDLKNDDFIVSVNVISQSKNNVDFRSILEIRGIIKLTRSPEKPPIPNGFIIGPKFRW